MLKFTKLLLILSISLCTLSLASLASLANAKPPENNLADVKNQLIEYKQSGQYLKDVTNQINLAENYLKQRVQENKSANHSKKLAIVLDIDETSLSNYPHMKEMNFGGTYPALMRAEMQGTDPAIPPTLNLYRYAKTHDVAVFFVTGRRHVERPATIHNLKEAGFYNWDGIYFKPQNYRKSSAVPYKSAVRKEITEMGYDIVLNIGDQQSDLDGGYADKEVKLPNPYYIVP